MSNIFLLISGRSTRVAVHLEPAIRHRALNGARLGLLTFYSAGGISTVELGIDVSKTDSHAVVDVKGEIDVYTAPKLREKLIELVSEGSYDVVVNLEGVDFLDSTGLGVLVGALKRVKAHDGSLSLVCTQDKILKIFKITGLTKVFPIHASVEEATGAAS
jgi:anti-sigma B factor antagonist